MSMLAFNASTTIHFAAIVMALLTVVRSDHFRYDLFKKNKSSL